MQQDLAYRALNMARILTYNEEPQGTAKHSLIALAHALDSRNIRATRKKDGLFLTSGTGESRFASPKEEIAYALTRSKPRVLRESGNAGYLAKICGAAEDAAEKLRLHIPAEARAKKVLLQEVCALRKMDVRMLRRGFWFVGVNGFGESRPSTLLEGLLHLTLGISLASL